MISSYTDKEKLRENHQEIKSQIVSKDSLTKQFSKIDSLFENIYPLKLPRPASVPPLQISQIPKAPKKPPKLPKPGSPPPVK